MQLIKRFVVAILNAAVRFYIWRNKLKVVVVAGSIGKTSTVSAIRTVLSQKYRVHMPATTYNTSRSIQLEIFDLEFVTTGWKWLVTSLRAVARACRKTNYEVLVIEIGTDHPGELLDFKWLSADIGVLTAIAPEHMENFKTMEAVAKEELLVADFCRQPIFNQNTVERSLVLETVAPRVLWYGVGTGYDARNYALNNAKATVDITCANQDLNEVRVQVIGPHSLDAILAATAVADQMGVETSLIIKGLSAVRPVKGRMQLLAGQQSSTLIDDSYNSSPRAAIAALDTLYQLDSPRRIAVLGSMNEMGGYSEQAHREVGAYCDPGKLDVVVTVGRDANDYLAVAAEQAGCKVVRCDDPYQAGRYVKSRIMRGAVILCKGSQNGVFTEESLKLLLANPDDISRLVRQSTYWLKQKEQQFPAQNAGNST